MQRNWIGRSLGAEIDFPLPALGEPIRVFTTRPDTIYGATFLVLAPEHPLTPRADRRPSRARRDRGLDRHGAQHAALEREGEESGRKAATPA